MKTLVRYGMVCLLCLCTTGCAAWRTEVTVYVETKLPLQMEGMKGEGSSLGRVEWKVIREAKTATTAKAP